MRDPVYLHFDSFLSSHFFSLHYFLMLSLSLHTSYIRRIKKSFKKVKAQHQRKERGKSVFLDVRYVFLVCVVVFLPFAAGVLFFPLIMSYVFDDSC